jgi:uncharacterized protein (DUF1501 family)
MTAFHSADLNLLSRRHLLAGLGLAATMPRVFAQAAPAGSSLDKGRLVVVFLRGAYDGLSAFVPHGDKDYYAIRPNIAIPAPDGTAQTAIKLDDLFGLHPALSPLLPMWKQGVLSFVPTAGLPAPNRSHFDAQYQMEIAQHNKTSQAPGWMNKLSALNTGSVSALGVGEANPPILSGDAAVKLIPRGQAAANTGVLANEKTRSALMDLYSGSDDVSVAFRKGAESRQQSARELTAERNMMNDQRMSTSREQGRSMDRRLDRDGASQRSPEALQAQMAAASNGAADPVGLALDAQHLATLMRNDRKLRVGFLSAGGWDTHANQGSVNGQLANNLGNLAAGIAQLRQNFNDSGDVIVVMSEFGRTSAENGTRGTDHGFGNALWLIGNSVNGGQWHGQWSGMAKANLNEGRDLPAHHDYRAVLAQVLRNTFALPDAQLASILPQTNWDQRLDKMLRKVA